MKPLAMLLVVTVLFLAYCGAQEVGEMRHESRSVQPENAKSVRAHLAMRAGGLNVGAADAFMEGDFSFNVADWKPKVNYEVNDAYGDSDVTLEVV